jgi:hypothetical protein
VHAALADLVHAHGGLAHGPACLPVDANVDVTVKVDEQRWRACASSRREGCTERIRACVLAERTRHARARVLAALSPSSPGARATPGAGVPPAPPLGARVDERDVSGSMAIAIGEDEDGDSCH